MNVYWIYNIMTCKPILSETHFLLFCTYSVRDHWSFYWSLYTLDVQATPAINQPGKVLLWTKKWTFTKSLVASGRDFSEDGFFWFGLRCQFCLPREVLKPPDLVGESSQIPAGHAKGRHPKTSRHLCTWMDCPWQLTEKEPQNYTYI